MKIAPFQLAVVRFFFTRNVVAVRLPYDRLVKKLGDNILELSLTFDRNEHVALNPTETASRQSQQR